MKWNLLFFLNSTLLGAGLAMDAFSVSLANGLHEPDMHRKKMCGIAGVFAFFQALMPMIGWTCVHTMLRYFTMFEKYIPWIASVLLFAIGSKMLADTVRKKDADAAPAQVGMATLFLQGVATSIDALSVGFAIAGYDLVMAAVCALIIAAVTFAICLAGLKIGRQFGTKFSDKAAILGGLVLIAIGLEILTAEIL